MVKIRESLKTRVWHDGRSIGEGVRARLLAYLTGVINQDLLLQNEYLAAENRILRAHLPQRLRLTDPERMMWPTLENGLGAKLSPGLPASPSRKRFSPGTGS